MSGAPPTGSTRMTRAPSWCRASPADGTAIKLPTSTTRSPASPAWLAISPPFHDHGGFRVLRAPKASAIMEQDQPASPRISPLAPARWPGDRPAGSPAAPGGWPGDRPAGSPTGGRPGSVMGRYAPFGRRQGQDLVAADFPALDPGGASHFGHDVQPRSPTVRYLRTDPALARPDDEHVPALPAAYAMPAPSGTPAMPAPSGTPAMSALPHTPGPSGTSAAAGQPTMPGSRRGSEYAQLSRQIKQAGLL